ncbi:MAG: hypothetical protein RLZZ592_1452 [Pseudomonadota bacterium]|jgi:uncharacterized membrane protein YjgN (DUF898 family)|nr:hypothetical protein [Pseudomonadota bacterium]
MSTTEEHHDRTDTVLAIRFTGTGRDYARIWIVNLVLTLATLGLYLPFARARQLRYLRQHTLIEGEALDFDGDGRELLRPHLALLGALLLYTLIAHAAPLLAALLLLALAPAGPLLLRRMLRWRLEHTLWRGQRLSFHGDEAQARRVFLPAAAPLALLLLGQALLAGQEDTGPDRSGWMLPALVSLALLGLLMLVPWLHARQRRYHHGHFGFGTERTRLDPAVEPADFYRLHGGVIALLLGALAINAVFAAWIDTLLAAAPMLSGLLLDMTLVLALRAWLSARTQDLLWNRTRSDRYRFVSDLPVPRLLMRSLKHLLLCVLTLGLYWPHAVMATTRLRLESVRIVRTQGSTN